VDQDIWVVLSHPFFRKGTVASQTEKIALLIL